MDKIHFHIDEANWKTSSEKGWGSLRWKELLSRERGSSKEFIFGLAELPPDGKLLPHSHRQAETDYILSGSGKFRLGTRSIEVGPTSGVYFPGGTPHSIETLGSESLRYLYTYACEKHGHSIDVELVKGESRTYGEMRNWNNADTRWAMREEIGELVWVEASKGYRVRARRLFDHKHGNAQEMKLGIAEMDPGIHYTLHYHLQPEIYFVISGRGIIYVGDQAIEASSG
jgi:mannose-6-phosphate isomerase-like protein (cupin superfamily)